MERAQFSDMSVNYPGVKTLYFKWTMINGTTFTINRAAEFLPGTLAIVRTGTGVYDLFPQGPPGVGLLDWLTVNTLAAEGNVALGGSGKTTMVNNLVASGKITVTFRRADTLAAADLAAGDIVQGHIILQTVSL